jgi:hydroxypyruvate reductase/glycerate 2-kinase
LLSGASICEINIIRKHLSKVKGGKLTQRICPAIQITLIFSDIPGNNLSIIASGPTVLDKSTKQEAEKIAKKYNLPRVKFRETPKEKGIFKKVHNILLLTNKTFLSASEEKAKKLGYKTKIYLDRLVDEASEAGKKLAQFSKKQGKNSIILAGGETPVAVKGQGKGGRCTELALTFLKYLPENITFCAFASDGQDNTDAAGAIIDEGTIKKSCKLKLDINKYLKNNDSYTFFQKTEDLIFTGPTGTNVADLFLTIKK